MIRLSIVIVTWNAYKYVEECLRSLAPICADNAEVIVVDNASSDGTPQLIEQEFPNVKLLRNESNCGFAKANNIAMAVSRGKYVCLVNSDVNVPGSCVPPMLAYMDEHPEIGLLGPRMRTANGAIGRSYMRFPSLWKMFCRALALDRLLPNCRVFGGFLMGDFDNTRTAPVDVLNGWFLLIRRSALEQVGGLDEGFFMYGEDIDWCRRFHKKGWQVVYYAGSEALHYGGGSSRKAPIQFYVEMQRANLRYYWKSYQSRLAQIAFACIVGIHHVLRLLGYCTLFLVKKEYRSEAAFKVKRCIACLNWLITAKTAWLGFEIGK